MTPSDRAVRRACELNHLESMREQARWSGTRGAIHEQAGILLYATGSSSALESNGAVRMTSRADAPEFLDTAEEWFGRRARGFTVYVPDGAADVEHEAQVRGYRRHGVVPALVCTAPVVTVELPSGLELRKASDESEVGDLVEVADLAFTAADSPAGTIRSIVAEPLRLLEPHLHCVVAYSAGRPVGCAMALLSHGVAGVYYVGTVPSWRGRGVGGALTACCARAAFDRGAGAVTLQASPQGESLYRQLGFTDLYGIQVFARPHG